ncbi:MAG: transcription termination factor Rho [Lachnospiraceae bacterium]|nr:transcription termination factor Rho [Lachnospiraceae bacterium]
MNNQYEKMSLAALKELAKEKGIKGVSALRKPELTEVLLQHDKMESEDVKNVPDEKKKEETKNVLPVTQEVQPQEKRVKENRDSAGNFNANGNGTNNGAKTYGSDSNGNFNARPRPYGQTGNFSGDRENRSKIQRVKNEYNTPDTMKNEMNRMEAKTDNNRGDNFNRDENNSRNNVNSSDSGQLDSGETKEGILEVLADGYGFIRCDNFLPGENDVYVSPAQIRRLNLKTGDIIVGNTKVRNQNEKFSALLYVKSINGMHPSEALKRKKFEDLTPIFPNERIHLETPGCGVAMRMVDIISPIGKGQRGMIVSQPKAGKTTLLKQIAKAMTINHPDMHLIILLIDERPEEVTDIKESIEGNNVEVIYSTFDELPENHKRVSEMVIERAKRLVEHKKEVVILLDSITRLARAYNLTVQASGRTLSGGLDPAALHMPKKFFGAARNMREGGSLTILATALVETGSRMDDVVFEEFKGTGNMELVLDRSLSEKRIFPAIDLPKSSTRRDDLLLTPEEMEANYLMRKAFNGAKSDEAVERIINLFLQTKNNKEFVEIIKKTKIV